MRTKGARHFKRFNLERNQTSLKTAANGAGAERNHGNPDDVVGKFSSFQPQAMITIQGKSFQSALTALELKVTPVAKLANRITVDPEQCCGRPCIRGMRIRVTDVLQLLSNGLTSQQVLEELPDLETEDIQACLDYASRRLDHPVVVP